MELLLSVMPLLVAFYLWLFFGEKWNRTNKLLERIAIQLEKDAKGAD